MAIVLVALWAATQKTAWQLGFTPRFGHAWFGLWRMPVYPPAFFWWWLLYAAYAPTVFSTGATIPASGGVMAAVVSFVLASGRTYGSARCATPSEVRGAGLLRADGVVLGRDNGAYLRHDGGHPAPEKVAHRRASKPCVPRSRPANTHRLRKQPSESVFGQIKQARGFRQFLLRGFKKMRAERALICAAHNLLKRAQWGSLPSAPPRSAGAQHRRGNWA
jgi:hypothetical protein